MPRQRNRSTRYSERSRRRAARPGPTPRPRRLGVRPSQAGAAVWRLARVTAVILAVVGVTVLLTDLIEEWPERESFDWSFWIGIGLMSPLGILLLVDDVAHDALFSDAGDGDAGGGFSDGGGGEGGGG